MKCPNGVGPPEEPAASRIAYRVGIFRRAEALAIARRRPSRLAVHGCGDQVDGTTIWMGGLPNSLRDKIAAALGAAGFAAHLRIPLTGMVTPILAFDAFRIIEIELELPARSATPL